MGKSGTKGNSCDPPNPGKGKRTSIKGFFDNDIVHQYIISFQQQLGMPHDRLWSQVADTLAVGSTTSWRWVKKLGKYGRLGQAAPEPRIKEILRYIAAINRHVQIPQGKDVVLKSLAATLTYAQTQISGVKAEAISVHDAELLRYVLDHPMYLDPMNGVTDNFISKMRIDVGHAVNALNADSTAEVLGHVRQLIKHWRAAWGVLNVALPYSWIHYHYAPPRAKD